MTREELELELAKCEKTRDIYWVARDTIASTGASYEITDGDSTRKLTRANLKEVQAIIQRLEARISVIKSQLSSVTLRKPKRTYMVRGN